MGIVVQANTIITLLIGLFLAGIINELVKTYQTFQMMLHFPTFAIWFPANLMIQYKNFLPVVNFDIMENIKPFTNLLLEISQDPNIDNNL